MASYSLFLKVHEGLDTSLGYWWIFKSWGWGYLIIFPDQEEQDLTLVLWLENDQMFP